MASVQIQQFDAHLTDTPTLDWVAFGEERRARATFIAISNLERGSGEQRREKATSIRWTAWGAQAETHAAWLVRGSHVNVVGRMQSCRFTDPATGAVVYSYDFVAESVHYLDTREQAQARRLRASHASPGAVPVAAEPAVASSPVPAFPASADPASDAPLARAAKPRRASVKTA